MIVNFVLMLTILLGCCALALDIGLLELKRLQMQNAADAGALGGMQEFDRTYTTAGTPPLPTAVKTAAAADATQNGFTQGVNSVTVTTVNAPAGYWANDYSAVQTTVSQPATFGFAGILRPGATTVSAQAVAYAAPCAYFMGTYYAPIYTYNGASTGTYATCPIYVNASLYNDYFATARARAIRVSGPAGNSSVSPGTTPPYYSVPSLADPLGWITSPTFSSCGSHPLPTVITLPTVPVTLYPGTYCGGITITAVALSATVTFSPGLYIITGGITWQGATVTSSGGVTLFFTKGGGYGYGKILITNNPATAQPSNISLTAPTTDAQGGIPGILVFGDRNWVPLNPVLPRDFGVQYANLTGDGIWYMTNTGIGLGQSLNWNCPNYCGIVTDNTYIYASNIRWNANYSVLPGGNPFRPRGTLVQ